MNKAIKQDILIIDDRKENLIALECLLEAPGRNIVKALSGNEALALTLEYDFALILMDVQMPGMDGFETAELMRGIEKTKYVPIIFVTAISKEQKYVFKGYEVGAVDYLFKPLDPEILKCKVNIFLELHKRNSELQQAVETIRSRNEEIEKHRRQIQLALDEISSLIQQVVSRKCFEVRFLNPNLKQCYVVMGCKNEICPCYGKEAMRCWQVSGTYCLEGPSGDFTVKQESCARCPVFKEATADPIYHIGEHFNNMMQILETVHKDVETAYNKLGAAQAQILQQEKMASIGQLAAGVAHEINNPLCYIISNFGSLQNYTGKIVDFINCQKEVIGELSSAENGNKEDALKRVNDYSRSLKLDFIKSDISSLIGESLEGANRLKRIVQDLKSFSRLDEAEYKTVDINSCLDSTINIAWNELKYKATLRKAYGDVPQIKCYPGQLNQVFLNILINAAHAIEKEGEITVTTRHDADYIYISISDTGCGIPEENLERIFEPFFTTKEVGKGTGLGLSIVYDIVKKHNGDIKVESKVGEGTFFSIKIPTGNGGVIPD